MVSGTLEKDSSFYPMTSSICVPGPGMRLDHPKREGLGQLGSSQMWQGPSLNPSEKVDLVISTSTAGGCDHRLTHELDRGNGRLLTTSSVLGMFCPLFPH